ncbi:MAG TPA: AbrB/MazE/SpoVT family DNA-binding domain-containing protein [Acidimicrobiales bacterium]
MRTAIDSAGRLVIPKPLRDSVGIKPGQPLEISVRGGRIEIEPAPTPMKLVREGSGVVAVPEVELPPLTADVVRDTLEQVRR